MSSPSYIIHHPPRLRLQSVPGLCRKPPCGKWPPQTLGLISGNLKIGISLSCFLVLSLLSYFPFLRGPTFFQICNCLKLQFYIFDCVSTTKVGKMNILNHIQIHHVQKLPCSAPIFHHFTSQGVAVSLRHALPLGKCSLTYTSN